MTTKSLARAGALLGLVACGGVGTYSTPLDPAKLRTAVETTLGLECSEIVGDNPVNCDRRHAYFTINEADDGSTYVIWLEIKHAAIDRAKVLKLLKRYGFSEEDFLAVVERGQRLTKGDFTMDSIGREKILVFD